ncbi:MAG: methyltransferase domain-containing protein [Bacteroidales bacterium]|nr:methyltransferase domain-containing protein [Bacteroidales bacterium]
MNLIENYCANKKVIHVGFADHVGLIETKIAKNEWLHNRLRNVSTRCIGIDINEEAVNFISKEFQIPDVYTYDLIHGDPFQPLLDDQWDLLVLAEIIEHVDNPELFLRVLYEKYKDVVKGMLITAPNAFWFKNATGFIRRNEHINSDHRYWFSPYTLAKIGCRAGWLPVEFEYSAGIGYPIRFLYQMFPMFGESVVMLFTPNSNDK